MTTTVTAKATLNMGFNPTAYTLHLRLSPLYASVPLSATFTHKVIFVPEDLPAEFHDELHRQGFAIEPRSNIRAKWRVRMEYVA